MWSSIIKLLNIVLQLILAILARRPKKARDVLTEESETAKAIEEQEAKAKERFGPRPGEEKNGY